MQNKLATICPFCPQSDVAVQPQSQNPNQQQQPPKRPKRRPLLSKNVHKFVPFYIKEALAKSFLNYPSRYLKRLYAKAKKAKGRTQFGGNFKKPKLPPKQQQKVIFQHQPEHIVGLNREKLRKSQKKCI
jgi:hypothetical protein